MILRVERDGGRVLLRPVGSWDEELQRRLEKEILGLGAVGVSEFVIDLVEVQHIRFRVLPALLTLFHRVRRQGNDLAIARPNSYLLEILAAGDVPRTIPVFPSEASAALGIRDTPAVPICVPQEGEREGSGLNA